MRLTRVWLALPVCETLTSPEAHDTLAPLTRDHLFLRWLIEVFSKFWRLVWSCLENVWFCELFSFGGVTGENNSQDSWKKAQSFPLAWSYVFGLLSNKLSISCQVQTLKPPACIFFLPLAHGSQSNRIHIIIFPFFYAIWKHIFLHIDRKSMISIVLLPHLDCKNFIWIPSYYPSLSCIIF